MVRPPSVARRALVALSVLAAFVVTTLSIALVLFAIPIVYVLWPGIEKWSHSLSYRTIVVFTLSWVPAALLVKGIFDVRPPPFVAPGRRLEREDAPALFALLDELATRTRTAAPREIYLAAEPNVGVTETGGFFGFRSRRVLVLGLPIVDWLTVQELRAVLAHELGHYLGGDTRLCGVLGYVEASFRAVLVAVRPSIGGYGLVVGAREIAHVIGRTLVKVFARLFLRWTRPEARRQELAADALSAEVAGREATIRALETTAALSPLYFAYVENDVASALAADAIPKDLMDGFCTFRERCRERDVEKRLLEELRAKRTDPFDSHPALAERVAALRALAPSDAAPEDDARSARLLFAEPEAVERWLVEEILERAHVRRAIRPMPWSEIGREAYTRAATRDATRTSLALHPLFPRARKLRGLFAAVVDALERGGAAGIAHAMDPAIARVPAFHQPVYAEALALRALATLFQGALVEAGAVALPSVGEGCFVFELDGERVAAAELAGGAMKSAEARVAIRAWAARLEATLAPPA